MAVSDQSSGVVWHAEISGDFVSEIETSLRVSPPGTWLAGAEPVIWDLATDSGSKSERLQPFDKLPIS
jgi:hypothetical protein